MIDISLSLDEKNFIADTSRDVEFARKLFGDLNHGILRPPDDGKVIILDYSDEEKEAPDEKTVDTELVVTSATVNLAPTTSAAVDDAPKGAKNDNSDDQGPDQEASGGNDNGSGGGAPYATTPKTKVPRQACLKDFHGSALLFFPSPLCRGVGRVM
jgi:hypothetical protein